MKSICWSFIIMCLLSGCSSCSRSGRKQDVPQSRLVNKSGSVIKVDTVNEGYQPPIMASSDQREKSLMDIVEQAEPCVFMVKTYDRGGKSIGQGTGFFIESSGVGVSNYHVFENGKTWKVQTMDGKKYNVEKIIAQSEAFDYIIFQVGTQHVSYLSLAAAKPKKGEDIVVLGNPQGLESTVTRGIVSSIRSFRQQDDALIQIDAAISAGSSGSPVMNMKGEVVGIATMKIDKCENCNFAFNIDVLRNK